MFEQQTGEQQTKTSVFISYSRKDAVFVEQLHRQLLDRGYNAFLDKTDIAPGEPWRERLAGLIQHADAVIFVLTDHSLSSDICTWEVDYALEQGKRLLPLVHGRATENVPEPLAALNYIFSDMPGMGSLVPDSLSDAALNSLCAALDVDIAWVRQHTIYTQRAA